MKMEMRGWKPCGPSARSSRKELPHPVRNERYVSDGSNFRCHDNPTVVADNTGWRGKRCRWDDRWKTGVATFPKELSHREWFTSGRNCGANAPDTVAPTRSGLERTLIRSGSAIRHSIGWIHERKGSAKRKPTPIQGLTGGNPKENGFLRTRAKDRCPTLSKC